MKVVIIGSGSIARRHLHVLTSEPDVEVVGHVARTPGVADAVAREWGGRGYRDVEELLDNEQVDAAWVCVPPGAHGEIELSLVDHGIPFFVEKPLDADCVTAERVAEALRRSGIIAGVAYHWRALDPVPELRRALEVNPPRMVLGEWHDSTPPPVWWRHQEESGGQMVEQATHLFDIARYLVGDASVLCATADRHERPEYPDADVADVSAALLHYESGATGVFTATCLLSGPAAIRVQFVCEGMLATLTQQAVVYEGSDGRREVPTGNDPFVDEDRAFLSAVRKHEPSLLYCTYEDALATHRLTCEVRAVAEGAGRGATRAGG